MLMHSLVCIFPRHVSAPIGHWSSSIALVAMAHIRITETPETPWKLMSQTQTTWELFQTAGLPASSELAWVELSLSYGRRSVDHFLLVSGSPLGPMTRFYLYFFSSDNCFVVLPVGRPLWREDRSYSLTLQIADWSGHWGPITIHYRLIWDCVPTSSLLTTRRDYGGGFLTCILSGVESNCISPAIWNTPWIVTGDCNVILKKKLCTQPCIRMW
jgi:hypothetical protein